MIDQFPQPTPLPKQYRLTTPQPRHVEDPLAWQADALCAQVGTELFFPEQGGSSQDAKRICAACDVRAQCLQYAIDHEERWGMWGGVSERNLRKLIAQKNWAAA